MDLHLCLGGEKKAWKNKYFRNHRDNTVITLRQFLPIKEATTVTLTSFSSHTRKKTLGQMALNVFKE